jgi:hypothetical protein
MDRIARYVIVVLTTMATVVLLTQIRVISFPAALAADPSTSVGDLRALPSTLVHSVGGTLVLLGVLVLNVYKPRGMTRYGWRKEQQRRALQRSNREDQPELSRQ